MDSNKNKTILVIDDTADNLDMISAILKGYDLIPCASGSDALKIVKEKLIHLILLDILMPEMDGYAVCTELKQYPDTREIPIIFMTTQTGEENIDTAYELGGADYVTKPFKPKELLARVRVQLHLQEMIRKLDMLETRDILTGIFNRRKFFELGVTLFDASGNELYVLILDIDHLKRINDQYGHHAGDLVLKTVTDVIKKVLPPGAIFGRIGGEEFSVMYTSQTYEQAMDVVSDILKAVSQTRITLNDGSTISCTISIGIGRKYSEFTSLDSLLKEADMTLHEAKESRQNTSILRAR